MKKSLKKIIALVLTLIMVFSVFCQSVFAAPASDLPQNMLDHSILRALAYTGYDVEAQKADGTLYQTSSISSRTPASVLSDISYGTSTTGFETVANSSTKTGLAPNIAKFEQSGLCCASFVTYYICNYLPNIEGVNTRFITDAVKGTGMNSQAVETWEKALGQLSAAGKLEKIGTSSSNVDRTKLTTGDIILFGNSTDSAVHAAIFAGTYNGEDYIIHVGNERGPEISIARYMAQSGSKSSTPNAYYHLPQDIFEQTGKIEINKKDTDGNKLAEAYFVATSTTDSSKQFPIGPTNASGYAVADNIPYDTYKVKETVFPTNYRGYGQTEWTVTVSSDNGGKVTVNAVNELIPGNLKIVKTSEDGKIRGVSFKIEGNGVNKTVVTGNNGEIQTDGLKPGTYKVSEITEEKYEPQETKNVTVVSGGTATVTFNNVLKRGDLTVTKTAEDGLVEGLEFRLSGTSLSGHKVNEYAVTDSSGKAYFKDVLIGTGYILEEVNTPDRYVIPEEQTADILWNEITDKSFNNALKKFCVEVFKVDLLLKYPNWDDGPMPMELSLESDEIIEEMGYPYGYTQGNATLEGAVYGMYKDDVLLDTYTTDKNGYFKTKYYPCDSGYYIKEISPSEGYLLDEEYYDLYCPPHYYDDEFNTEYMTVYEQIIRGTIRIAKHTDNGHSGIETPETGAEFKIYLKSAGSYENARETERETLVIDEIGIVETKKLPYGVYTVVQTKGWEGKEMMPPFDVNICEEGKAYGYIINNATFKSFVEIVKKDKETGKIIPAAGVGFKVRNIETNEYVVQKINYPTPTDVEVYYTDESGKLMMPYALEYGKYEIIEQSTPYGYVLDSTPVKFNVDGTKDLVTVEKYNMPQKGKISITKSGEVFWSVTERDGIYTPTYEVKGLEGAVFTVTATEDIVTPDGTKRYSKGETVDTITTDKSGVGVSKELYLGKYEVKETKAPYGMVLNAEVKQIELKYAGQEVKVFTEQMSFYNTRQKVKISLKKLLLENESFNIGKGEEILAVSFGLFAEEDITAADGKAIPKDGMLEKLSCDKDGNIVFTVDIPVGARLYVKELTTDEHYIISEEKFPIVFDYAGQDVAEVTVLVNEKEIENQLILATVTGLKTDRETGEVIAGVMFGLFKGDETEFSEKTAIITAVTDKEGVFNFKDVPYGNWLVKEIKPTGGYLANDSIYHIAVKDNEQIIELNIVNDRIPEIDTKADINGKKTADAKGEITITDTVSYKHLIVGKEYVIKGILMDKSTGKPFLIDGKEITAEIKFVPKTANGEVKLSFTFNADILKRTTSLVVFERLYKDGYELTSHTDIEDEGQTVELIVPVSESPKTGDTSNPIKYIALMAISALSILVLTIKRRSFQK